EWATITASIVDPAAEWVVRFNIDAHRGKLQRVELVGGYFYALKTESNFDLGKSVEHGASGLLVEDCKLHDSGRDVVKLTPGSNDVTIWRTEIFNSGRRDPTNAEGIDNVNADRMIVQDSYLHDLATTGIYAKGGASDCVIERNRIENAGALGITLGGDTDPEWFDQSAAYYENINGVVRNNIVVDTEFAGVALTGSLGARVYNNTLVNVAQSGQAAVLLNAGEIWINGVNRITPNKDAALANNIVTTAAGSTRPLFQIRENGLDGPLALANNRYFAAEGSATFVDAREGSAFSGRLAGWQAHTGEANSSEGHPGLDSAQHLNPSSACRDAGVALAGFAGDIGGDQRTLGSAWDIGADEFRLVRVEYDPWNRERMALVAYGTTGADSIHFQSLNQGTQIAVQVNGVTYGPFTASALSRLIAYGYDGNDRLTVESSLTRGAFLAGGVGDDTLAGSTAADILLGGAGNDTLVGGAGDDLVFGGIGTDELSGGLGTDLMVAGATVYDNYTLALGQIIQEWSSSRAFRARNDLLIPDDSESD
ncbi:MAG: right-handed parallel beta-helix repeat-containing protein, partial [Gemmataceae bacterium]|nr:right-handed parallel beta-helix repeat-containing protein [Gemmataceae bacterium]